MPLPTETLNVLHITARADSGGGPEVIRQLIAGAPPDLRHFVACPREPPYWGRWNELLGSSAMHAIPHRSFHPRALAGLARFARAASIDVIHSHGFGGGLYARLLAAWLRLPCLHTFHGYYPRGLSGFARQAAENVLAPWTSAGIAVSASEAGRIGHGVPFISPRLSVIHNGVVPPPAVAGKPAGGLLRILAINRLESQKNPFALLQIAELCARRMGHGSIQFRIVGDGPLRPALEREIERRGLRYEVRLLGTLPDCRNELASASIFLSTAIWEGMSLALLEAMAHGVVPVVSQVMGNVDVVEHGRNGILFPLRQIDAAAEAIRLLARDETLRARFAQNARESIARRFPVSGTVGAYAALYRQLTVAESHAPQALEAHP